MPFLTVGNKNLEQTPSRLQFYFSFHYFTRCIQREKYLGIYFHTVLLDCICQTQGPQALKKIMLYDVIKWRHMLF